MNGPRRVPDDCRLTPRRRLAVRTGHLRYGRRGLNDAKVRDAANANSGGNVDEHAAILNVDYFLRRHAREIASHAHNLEVLAAAPPRIVQRFFTPETQPSRRVASGTPFFR